MRQLVYQVCYTRYHVSLYLWLIGSVLKHCKVPKYYEWDCRFSWKIRKLIPFGPKGLNFGIWARNSKNENSRFPQFQNFESFWVTLQFFESLRLVLGHFGWFWLFLTGFGWFWLVWSRFGSFQVLVSTMDIWVVNTLN